jgi:iron complex transport system permease protein
MSTNVLDTHAADTHAAIDAFLVRRANRQRLALWLLAGCLGVATIASLVVGARVLSPGAVVDAFMSLLAGDTRTPDAALLGLRLPRVAAGLLVGAALGLAGAAMQGLFRNPLVDPGLLGTASGARLGAILFLVLGGGSALAAHPALRLVALPLAAFAGALASVALVWRIASRRGQAAIATLILAGVALAVLEESATSLLQWVADDTALRLAALWRMGSLAGLDVEMVAVTMIIIAIPAVFVLRLAPALDALALGETEAAHLGIDPQRTRRRLVIATSLLVAASVAIAGIIAFVGLVAPHIIRLAVGASHRVLLLGSALCGALLVVVADMAARTLVSPAELPIGAMMAVLGGPFFLWLVARRAQGGVE